MQCSSSAMSISKAGENGMQAELHCLTRNQKVGGTKCHSENFPSLPAFGSAQVLLSHKAAEKGRCAPEYTKESSLSVLEKQVLCEVLSLIWLM